MLKYLLFILIVTGCSYNKNIQIKKSLEIKKDPFISSFVYYNISKDAVMEAAKKTFIFTNKKFVLNSYRNLLTARKTDVSNYFFTTLIKEDIWFLNVEEVDNKTIAKVYTQRIYNENDNIQYLSKNSHKIFWKRINYFLSIETNWEHCFLYINSLCDIKGQKYFNKPSNDDKIKNILISQRHKSKGIIDINDDILLNESFSITEHKKDILNVKDTLVENSNQEQRKPDANIEKILNQIKKETNSSLK